MKARLCLLLLLLAAPAGARTIRFHWKAVPGAARYELSIRRAGAAVVTREAAADQLEWREDLAPGFYYYLVRAVDQGERPGEWTSPVVVRIDPRPPDPTGPASNEKIELTSILSRVTLAWQAPDPTKRYEIQLTREGERLPPLVTGATTLALPDPAGGKYRWRVRAIEPRGNSVPSTVKNEFGDRAESDYSGWRAFSVTVGESYPKATASLPAPQLLFPTSEVAPPGGGLMTLEWTPVDGAVAYEVKLKPTTGRTPAWEPKPTILRTTDTQLAVEVDDETAYEWTVRALSSLSRSDAGSEPAESSFSISKDAPNATPLPSRVRFLLGTSPFDMTRVIPSRGVRTSPGGSSTDFGVESDIWFQRRWGFYGRLNAGEYTFGGGSNIVADLDLAPAYRVALEPGSDAWSLALRLGLAFREYVAITPSTTTLTFVTSLDTIGAWVGASVEKPITKDILFIADIAGYFPVMTLDGFRVLGGQIENWRFGAEGRYRFTNHWGGALGVGYERRGISYATASTATPDEIHFDLFHIGIGVYYTWD